jgi:hypothetical protein
MASGLGPFSEHRLYTPRRHDMFSAETGLVAVLTVVLLPHNALPEMSESSCTGRIAELVTVGAFQHPDEPCRPHAAWLGSQLACSGYLNLLSAS